jgi:hypothetical protein
LEELLRHEALRLTPHHIPDVVGHQQRAARKERETDRTAARVAVALVEKSGEHAHRLAGWFAAVERHEDHLASVSVGAAAMCVEDRLAPYELGTIPRALWRAISL